jgi:hypothetical protein
MTCLTAALEMSTKSTKRKSRTLPVSHGTPCSESSLVIWQGQTCSLSPISGSGDGRVSYYVHRNTGRQTDEAVALINDAGIGIMRESNAVSSVVDTDGV